MQKSYLHSWTVRGVIIGAAVSVLSYLSMVLSNGEPVDGRLVAGIACGALASGLGGILGRRFGSGGPVRIRPRKPSASLSELDGLG